MGTHCSRPADADAIDIVPRTKVVPHRTDVGENPSRLSKPMSQLANKLDGDERSRRISLAGDAELFFPVHAVAATQLSNLGTMLSHESARDAGLLVKWKPAMGPLVFISHQWLAHHEPDPAMPNESGAQWKIIRSLASQLADFASASMAFDIVAGSEDAPDARTASDKQPPVYVRLDFWSIPQDADSVADRTKAIQSIPAYVAHAACMIVVAPAAVHQDTGQQCDMNSWKERGWCRLEQNAFLLKVGEYILATPLYSTL